MVGLAAVEETLGRRGVVVEPNAWLCGDDEANGEEDQDDEKQEPRD
jgi:hypothetical protein